MARTIFSSKAAARRRRWIRGLLLVLLVGFAWQWGIPYLLNLPCWIVEEVILVSCPSELHPLVGKHTAPLIGQPLYQIWWRQAQVPVQERLQESPLVRTAQLRLALPNQVLLTVTARKPFCTVGSQGRFYSVDKEGILLGEVLPPPSLRPVIWGLKISPDRGGTGLPEGSWRMVLDCLQAAQDQGISLAHLALHPEGTVWLQTSLGERVFLGRASELERKLNLFTLLREDLLRRKQQFEYIDVSVPDTPVWRPQRLAATPPGGP